MTYTSRKTDKTVRIRVRHVGQSYGYVGELVARNGRVVDETDTYTFPASAHNAALALCR